MLADSSPETRLSEFERQVRDALLHLYEPAYLETHYLARQETVSPALPGRLGSRLFQSLMNAVEALHPAAGLPSDSRAWRLYRLIELRYVEGLSAGDVIERLAISKSQYQRDHARALTAVASLFRGQTCPHEAPPSEPDTREALVLSEAQHLAFSGQPDFVDLGQVISDIVALLRPIVEENDAEILVTACAADTTLRTDRVILRQLFMELVEAGIDQYGAQSLTVNLDVDGSTVVVTLLSNRCRNLQVGTDVDVARHLVEALGGDLQIDCEVSASVWRVTVRFPRTYRPIVLIVDNHPDFVEMVSRYLGEDGWDAISAGNVRQALSLALKWHPDVILLDVMLPEQDGWELIRELRSQLEIQATPVVICSVLYDPRVARALGADAYLPKPVTPRSLGQVLAPYHHRTGKREPEPSL